MPNAQSVNHDPDTRLQALALIEQGIAIKIIEAVTQLSNSSIYRLKKQARERDYNPEISRQLKLEYVMNKSRSDRSLKVTVAVKQAILKTVRKDRDGREKSSGRISFEHELSAITILTVLKRNNMRSCKITKKPCLTEAMKEARLQFCLRYQHGTIKDGKNVIGSDETVVLLNSRRGKIRVGRTLKEGHFKSVTRRRGVGAMKFMFGGCFSGHRKNPYHIWKSETVKEKKEAEEELKKINDLLKPQAKQDGELENDMRRMRLRNKGGKKSQGRGDKKHGKMIRDGKKGRIDGYLYQKKVLIPKLLPFAKEHQKDFSNTLVQEDKVLSHKFKEQNLIGMNGNILRLLGSGNSPDLNMIEPCGSGMKRKITRKEASRTRKDAEKAGIKCGNDELQMNRIKAGIERIPRHIQEIIRLEGGNEYREDKEADVNTQISTYDKEKRRARYQRSKRRKT